MSEYDLVRLMGAMLFLVLLASGAGLALLWQRQQAQTALLDRLLTVVLTDQQAQSSGAVVSAQEAIAEATPANTTEEITEEVVTIKSDSFAASLRYAELERVPEPASAAEDRLLAFIRQQDEQRPEFA